MAEKQVEKKEKKEETHKEQAAKVQAKPKSENATTENTKTSSKVVTKKFIQYVKKENKKKSAQAYANQKKIVLKKHTPVFRGRFGKKNIRRKSIEKWDKWRKPHGIDLDKGIEHGCRPKIGYRRSTETRDIHPSGFIDVLVCNKNDLAKIDAKTQAARLSRTLGKKKRNELVTEANKKGIWVLN